MFLIKIFALEIKKKVVILTIIYLDFIMVDTINDFDIIIREGWLTKQSKFLKEWRKLVKENNFIG